LSTTAKGRRKEEVTTRDVPYNDVPISSQNGEFMSTIGTYDNPATKTGTSEIKRHVS